ncbi:MAG: extracellular solute-binding protein [Bacteroidetes bacterium]|nr:extracellular solute-binding protein [Bacteroidota bacterium]MBU1116922.1 extracellular solute-binding protein [Bacteroidota bacterium]MBU1798351.1 extracellular solute-binding protein [Bacteroidota bacterium]
MIPKNIKNIRLILVVLLVLISALFTIILNLFPLIRNSSEINNAKRIYFAENITPAHAQLIEEFNEINKGKIEVIAIDLPYKIFTTNKRKEIITKNLRNSSSRIDIYAIDVVWGERFIKWAEPLNSYFSTEEIDSIFDEAKNYCYFDSTLYSIPFFVDIGVLYYRDDLLKEMDNYENLIKIISNGISWEELVNIKTPKSKYKYLFQADNYEGLMCNFLEIAGRNSFNNSNFEDFKFRKDTLSERLNFIRDLIYKQKFIPEEVVGFDENKTFSFALENDVPFFRGWPTGKRNIILNKKLIPKLKYLKFAPLPKFAGESPVSTIGGWNLIVSKNSKYKDESIAFIKFLLSKSSQKYIWENNGYLPVLKSFFSDSLYLSKYPELKLFKSLIESGVYRIKHPQYTRISDILTKNLNLYFNRELSTDDFINNSLEEINSINKRYLK